MADDPYKVLGVGREASAEQIRAAYRKLAKTHHPDLNPGDKKAEEAFKAISTAYDLLGDAEKRARFDRGEIDAAGNERAPQFHPGAGGFGGGGFDDIFANIFEQRTRGPARGQDERYLVNVSFLEAVNGGPKRLDLPAGQSLEVKIPPGSSAGDVLRLRGKGAPGRNGGPPGDALIELQVHGHKFFRREGRNIHLDLPVSLKEAVLGGKVTVPTPSGDVVMTLKPHTEGGTELRLRGKGVPAHGRHHVGDLLVKLVVKTGPVDEALEAFLRGWEQAPFDPRAKL
ncbi:J domain-containing protein [Acidocella sp.]|uniref:J domain-containing protein n=1 Tax=Acidocella sp. TaxID=50710 RepID=UPI0026352CFD|nr:J domain-containing protein [Acidocella sp.]